MSTLSRATIPKYVLNFFLWGPSAFPVAGSTCTTGLSAPGGLVDNDHRREALRVRFTADVEADASEVGGGGGGGGGARVSGKINSYLQSFTITHFIYYIISLWKV